MASIPPPPLPRHGVSSMGHKAFTAWLTLKTVLKPFSINEIKTGLPTCPRLFPPVPTSWGGMQSWGPARTDLWFSLLCLSLRPREA